MRIVSLQICLVLAVCCSAQKWTNWAGSQTSNYLTFTEVETESDIAALVRQAFDGNETVSVLGSGHAYSPLVPTSGHMISLKNYNRLIAVRGTLATFEAGILTKDAYAALEPFQLTLENTPAMISQTLAGAILTNTHGSGDTQGLSAFVTSLRLITGQGGILDLTPTLTPDLFNAAVVGVGVMGILSTITVRTVPLYRLKREISFYPLSDVNELLPFWEQQFEQYYPRFEGDLFTVESFSRTTDPIDPPNGGCWSLPLFTNCTDVAYKAISREDPGLPRDIPLRQMEAFFDRRDGFDFVREWFELEETILADLLPFLDRQGGFRFARRDELDLSMMFERDVFIFDMSITYTKESAMKEFMQAFSDLAWRFGGRFHWGKESLYSPQQSASQYPKFDIFVQQRRLVDPTGVFLNDYTTSLFR